MILGLDISTSIIGWCLLDESEVEDIGHIDLTKIKDFYDKCDEFWKFLDFLKCLYPIDNLKVFIEEPVKMFKSNQSMAQTISILQRFNATCCYLIYREFDIKPTLIMESRARKLCNIKVPKGVKGKEKKQFVFERVKKEKSISEIKWAYKRTGNPKDFCYDQADAFVVAKAGAEMLNES